MANFDVDRRTRLAYQRFQWLSALSGAAIVVLTVSLNTLNAFDTSANVLVMAFIGFAFTLFVSVGVQIVASAADRWVTGETVSPAMLVWEWRMVVLAQLSFLISMLLLVSFCISNLRMAG